MTVNVLSITSVNERTEEYVGEIYKILKKVTCYLGFESWWKNKILPEISEGTRKRRILAALDVTSQKLMGFSILKDDLFDPKICTLYVLPMYRLSDVGSELIRESILYGGRYITVSKRIDAYGMGRFLVKNRFYLSDIISLEGSPERVYTLEDRPGHLFKPKRDGKRVLISIKSEYCDKIFSGTKLVELRRSFPTTPERMMVYSSGRDKRVVGMISIFGIKKLKVEEIWDTYKYVAGISRRNFLEYFKGLEFGYVIELGDSIKDDIPVEIVSPNFTPVQSFKYL